MLRNKCPPRNIFSPSLLQREKMVTFVVSDFNFHVAMEYVCVNTPRQIEELAEMGGRIFGEYYLAIGIHSKEQNDYMIERFFSEKVIARQMAEKGYEYYFFCDNGRKIGFCAVQPADGKLFLSKLYLESAERGKGYGKEALGFIEGLCAGQGLTAVWLTVNRGNAASVEFYLRNGFKILRSEDNDIGQGYVMNDYVMELAVAPM